MIEALDRVMPTFDPDITKIAKRKLIDSRDIDARAGLLASKVTPGCPVKIELSDVKTRALVEQLEVDAVLVATGRVPTTKELNLDAIGVKTNRGFIQMVLKSILFNKSKLIRVPLRLPTVQVP